MSTTTAAETEIALQRLVTVYVASRVKCTPVQPVTQVTEKDADTLGMRKTVEPIDRQSTGALRALKG